MYKIKEKIDFLVSEFKKENYYLKEEEKCDLKYRLLSKPVQLYLIAIKKLKDEQEKINYQNVKELIIIDIKIRDIIKKIITALEEIIRVQHLDEISKISDCGKYLNSRNSKLNEVIKKLKKSELDSIRKIRNEVNHISYPILFNKLKEIINNLKKIQENKFDFLNIKKFDKYIQDIKNIIANSSIQFIKSLSI